MSFFVIFLFLYHYSCDVSNPIIVVSESGSKKGCRGRRGMAWHGQRAAGSYPTKGYEVPTCITLNNNNNNDNNDKK